MGCCGRARAAWRRRPRAARRSSCGARPSCRSGWGARAADLRGGVLPDEHRDGRAAVRRRSGVRGAGGLGARVRPVLGHRHDRAHAGTARGRAVGDRAGRAGGRRRDRRSAAQRGHERPFLRGRHAHGAARAPLTSRPSGRRRRRPSARGAVQEGRAPHHRRVAQAHRVRLLQPHHARPQRRRTGEAGGRSARSARWTCSRRLTTSSASRCSSARRR